MSSHNTQSHNHSHDHKHTKEVSNRLARAIGHLQKVKQMVDSGEDCSEVLIQLAAVKSAINNTGKLILKDHLEHCIVHAVQDGDEEMLEELNEAIDKFMK
ncbi:MAG TPA: metal-sensing transcriptional repressor [Candidatus Eubacterium faecigallinarum]|nr:metal-sensing transcriptional repressor [Candidatus Eubacterium faecigallinarum]